MEYRWCEDDFYEETSFREEISKDDMIKKMQDMQKFFDEYGLAEYVEMYRNTEELVESYIEKSKKNKI